MSSRPMRRRRPPSTCTRSWRRKRPPDAESSPRPLETTSMARIALGGLMHESNTFAPGRTDLTAFVSGGLETGAGIFERWGEAHHEVGGFFEAAARNGFEVV